MIRRLELAPGLHHACGLLLKNFDILLHAQPLGGVITGGAGTGGLPEVAQVAAPRGQV